MGENESHLPVDAPDPAALNALLAGYDVQELVACGGMGAVYRGTQVSLDREVAIKVLPRELAEDAEFSASFAAEARAMAKLAHPNLISVFDFGEVEGMFYLVMEFVEGDSLYAACHDQLVDPKQAVEIVQAVSAGLGVAHEEGIIHRDIKPANILIGEDLVPKLGDFGLAVPSDDVASGLAMGTPGFVAPEVMADSEAATPASDVFALGVMLHQMLSGITPDGETEPDLALVPLAHGLRTLVQKALSDQPSMRFQDGREMAEALGGWLEKAKRGLSQAPTAGGQQWGKALSMSGGSSAYSANSGGGGGRLAMWLVLIGLIGGGAWFVSGMGDSDDPNAHVPPVKALILEDKPAKDDVDDPPVKRGEDPLSVPKNVLSGEEIAEKYLAALKESRDEMIASRLVSFRELRDEVKELEHWSAYLDLVDAQTWFLPEYVCAGDGVKFESSDGERLQQLMDAQGEGDEEHLAKVEELHGAYLREIRKSELNVKPMVNDFWEAWVESLGVSPVYVMGINLAGEWEGVDSQGGEVLLRIDNRNGLTILRRELKVSGSSLLNVSQKGWIAVLLDSEDRSRKWSIRLRSGELVGQDESGAKLKFSRKSWDLMDYVNSGEAPEEGPGAAGLRDPELVELNGKYMGAVERQIGPIVRGYHKAVRNGLALTTRRNDVRGVEQMGLELVRVESLTWKTGYVMFDEIEWESAVPLSQQGNKSRFDRDFKEKMGKLQNAYLLQVNGLLAKARAARKDTGEFERELEKFTMPRGMVRARYVKLQANKADGVRFAAIAELVFLDRRGEKIAGEGIAVHSVSSNQVELASGAGEDCFPEHVLDGKEWTKWHSVWKPEWASWPHWISVDLQKETLIGGFRLLPRQDHPRHGDIRNWTLFVSKDGEDWQEVARGEFPEGTEEHEFLFEK